MNTKATPSKMIFCQFFLPDGMIDRFEITAVKEEANKGGKNLAVLSPNTEFLLSPEYARAGQTIKIAVSHSLTAISPCTGGEARTPDTRFWRPVLYQLSYSRVCGCKGSRNF